MESAILTSFLVLLGLEFIFESILNELNLRHVKACWAEKKVPEAFQNKISPEDYDKSIAYTLIHGRLERWDESFDRVILLVVLFSGVLGVLDRFAARLAGDLSLGIYGGGIMFCLAVGLIFTLATLPTELYSTFDIEAKFGFKKTTVALFVSDKLKGLALAVIVGAPFLYVVLWLMDVMGSYWWLWAFAFITVFQLSMIVIFPTFIAPWFNKFEPLKEG